MYTIILVSLAGALIIFLIAYLVYLQYKPPVIGQKYKLTKDIHNPFNDYYVIVTEVKHGFVQYQYPSGNKSNCSVSTFNACYSKVN